MCTSSDILSSREKNITPGECVCRVLTAMSRKPLLYYHIKKMVYAWITFSLTYHFASQSIFEIKYDLWIFQYFLLGGGGGVKDENQTTSTHRWNLFVYILINVQII